jgi:hypothetical protein
VIFHNLLAPLATQYSHILYINFGPNLPFKLGYAHSYFIAMFPDSLIPAPPVSVGKLPLLGSIWFK